MKKGVDDVAALLGVTAVMDLTCGDIALMKTRLEEAIAIGVDDIAIAIANPQHLMILLRRP